VTAACRLPGSSLTPSIAMVINGLREVAARENCTLFETESLWSARDAEDEVRGRGAPLLRQSLNLLVPKRAAEIGPRQRFSCVAVHRAPLAPATPEPLAGPSPPRRWSNPAIQCSEGTLFANTIAVKQRVEVRLILEEPNYLALHLAGNFQLTGRCEYRSPNGGVPNFAYDPRQLSSSRRVGSRASAGGVA
jgi:hypothetical protein